MSNEELLSFFKALSDANRLRIIGLLSHSPYTVEQLAALLDLRPSTISHHLSKLAHAGLVSAKADGYYSVYQFHHEALEDMAKRLLSRDTLPSLIDDLNLDAYDQKVLKDFYQADGSLKTIPAQRKKLQVILRNIVASFKPGVKYNEKQVNQILSKFHEDTATLRRELIGASLLKRERGIYWRPSREEAQKDWASW